ncbi:hypothetical protein B5G33_03855 [Blautia sp. An81]|nr:hypothetical protein B5G33_03855 [Blautia sp. An81]
MYWDRHCAILFWAAGAAAAFLKGKFLKKEGAQVGWKTPFLMIKKGNFFGVQAISAPIFRR